MPDQTLEGKFHGALLGAIVGDALGAPLEGTRRVSLETVERLLENDQPLRYTDDGHMTLGLAGSLIECGGFDGAHMARTFADNYFAEPWRGYGAGPPRIFQQIASGAEWHAPARTMFGGSGSYGNGAAMRVAPVALFAYDDVDEVKRLARETAAITHTHPLGVEGAVMQAVSVALLLGRSPDAPFNAPAILESLEAHIEHPDYRQQLDAVRRLLPDAPPEDVVAGLGSGIAANESVSTALYVFLRSPESFDEVIRLALSLGGDTDTIASMAGALAGAALGASKVPARWIERVEGTAEVQRLAGQLYRRSTSRKSE